MHWRPRTYWKPGTDVTVNADINSIPAGNGVYGQLSRSTSFHVGDAMVSRVDVKTHRMRVFRNGTLLRTIPISAGKPGFTTRSGTKVIIEKFRRKRMDAATTGISKDDPEYYNLSNVEYAMRVTYSGEFLHAAPWSVGSQGSDNVSHGCVGMSTENAAWLFNLTKRGDVVEVTRQRPLHDADQRLRRLERVLRRVEAGLRPQQLSRSRLVRADEAGSSLRRTWAPVKIGLR